MNYFLEIEFGTAELRFVLNGNKKDKSGQLLIYALVIHIILLSQKFL